MSGRAWIRMSAVALAAAAALLTPAISQAATITVAATSDDVVNNGTCTLREAIDEANANSDAVAVDCNTWSGTFGNDTIQLIADDYVLDEPGAGDNANGIGDLDVDTDAGSGNLTIAGAGAGATVITRALVWGDRLIDQIAPGGGSLTVSDLTVTGGNVTGDGGGIHSDAGTLLVQRVRLGGNTATLGGGIYADGAALSIIDSDVSSNTSSGGGGVQTLATTTTIDSTLVFDNTAIGSGGTQGGGISAQNTTLNLVDSIIKGNDADEGSATAEGGGMVLLGGGGTIRGTEISENVLFGPGANIGAGMRLQPSNPVDIVNSTISDNEAPEPMENGAGLVLSAGTVNLVHSTIGPNPVRAGGVSGLLQMGGTLNVRGSVVETSGGEAACGGAITSLGHNVFTDGSCGAPGTGDEANADPMLGLLLDNGGPDAGAPPGLLTPVRSHLPANASTAVDHVPQANCTDVPAGALTRDQRGLVRPMDFNGNGLAECDAGSIELQATPVTPVTPTAPAAPASPKKKQKCKKKKRKKRAAAAKRCKKKRKKKR